MKIHLGGRRASRKVSRGSKLRIHTSVRNGRIGLYGAVNLIAALLLAGSVHSADIDTVVAEENKGNKLSAQSQKRIDKIDDETSGMAADYRAAIDQIESLRVYNAHIEKLIADQEAELASLDEQIASVTLIGRQVTPMMIRMVDALEEFIEMDVPLLLNERRERLAQIRDLMERADVANSEKYRRITEAYQIENEYGRTIEAYTDTIDIGGEEKTLEFLRVGRIALLFQSLDGSEVGAWDNDAKQWVMLPPEYKDSIKKGIRMAQKQAAPDLIRIPVLAPEDV